MNKLNSEQLNNLISDSTILIADNSGPKVLLLANKNCLKFFRLKKWLSSSLFYHYADRFVDNANKLNSLNIPTLKILNTYKIPKDFIKYSKLTKAVEYTYVRGHSIRDLIKNNLFTQEHAHQFGKFMAKLHQLGVYFRACHFGNILYDRNNELDNRFKLIDIENMKFYKQPLSKQRVLRNFKQMTRYDIDKNWLTMYKKNFEAGYGATIEF